MKRRESPRKEVPFFSLKILLCQVRHFSSFGDAEDEALTLVILRVEPDLATKELDDGLADGETQVKTDGTDGTCRITCGTSLRAGCVLTE